MDITDHDELTYEKLISSLPERAQRKLRQIAVKRGIHIARVIKEAIVSFADSRQELRKTA